ncbi:MAG: hypothetical protein KKI08_19570 [Armatimonadetes bacterium]|nr:hypothetical protein [Armatimonadota bacterium]
MQFLPYIFVAVVVVLLIGSFLRLHRVRISRLVHPQSSIEEAKLTSAGWREELASLLLQERHLWQGALGGPPIPPLTDEEFADPVARKEHGELVSALNLAKLRFTLGLICLLIWPALVLLNCAVLGQVMELFVPPGGEPVVLPVVGWEMDPMALVFALLIALCQAVFVLWFTASRGWAKGIAALLMVAGVAFETGGAYMRAKIIEEGMGGAGILAGQSALVSMLIGFVVPVAEMIASEMAVSKVVAPLLELPSILASKLSLRLKLGYSATSIIAQCDPSQAHQRPLTAAQQEKLRRQQERIEAQRKKDELDKQKADRERERQDAEEELRRKAFVLPEVEEAATKERALSEKTRELVLKVNGLNAEIGKLADQVAEMEQSQATATVKDPEEALKHFDSALAEAGRERILTADVPPTPNQHELGDEYPERLQSVLVTCEKLLSLLDDNVSKYLSHEMERAKLMLVPLHSIDNADSGILTWAKLRARLNILQSAQQTLKVDHGTLVQEHQAGINGLNQLVNDPRLASVPAGAPAPGATTAALGERNITANRRLIGDVALRLGYGTMGQMGLTNLRALLADGSAETTTNPSQGAPSIGQGSVFALLDESETVLEGPIQANLTAVGARMHGKVDVPRSCKVQPRCTTACPICGKYSDQVERKYNDFVTLEVEPRHQDLHERKKQVERLIELEEQAHAKGSAWQRFVASLRRMFGGQTPRPRPVADSDEMPRIVTTAEGTPTVARGPNAAKTTTIDSQGNFVIKDR